MTQTCLDRATLWASSLRSVWSEARLTYSSPPTLKTKVSASPDESGPTAYTRPAWLNWFSAMR
ncbi:Uncharacterised protein [Bordetella pertussis]|nr:Uncharacterised protein [Bordetella pertussis]CFP65154.1 Uncharacterised protein [Bordetella pertussis]